MRYADSHCTYVEIYKPEHIYRFTGPCIHTGKPYTVDVPGKALYAYRQGTFIQDAMPMLSVDDREFLVSGYSPEGWTLAFGEELGWQEYDDDEV